MSFLKFNREENRKGDSFASRTFEDLSFHVSEELRTSLIHKRIRDFSRYGSAASFLAVVIVSLNWAIQHSIGASSLDRLRERFAGTGTEVERKLFPATHNSSSANIGIVSENLAIRFAEKITIDKNVSEKILNDDWWKANKNHPDALIQIKPQLRWRIFEDMMIAHIGPDGDIFGITREVLADSVQRFSTLTAHKSAQDKKRTERIVELISRHPESKAAADDYVTLRALITPSVHAFSNVKEEIRLRYNADSLGVNFNPKDPLTYPQIVNIFDRVSENSLKSFEMPFPYMPSLGFGALSALLIGGFQRKRGTINVAESYEEQTPQSILIEGMYDKMLETVMAQLYSRYWVQISRLSDILTFDKVHSHALPEFLSSYAEKNHSSKPEVEVFINVAFCDFIKQHESLPKSKQDAHAVPLQMSSLEYKQKLIAFIRTVLELSFFDNNTIPDAALEEVSEHLPESISNELKSKSFEAERRQLESQSLFVSCYSYFKSLQESLVSIATPLSSLLSALENNIENLKSLRIDTEEVQQHIKLQSALIEEVVSRYNRQELGSEFKSTLNKVKASTSDPFIITQIENIEGLLELFPSDSTLNLEALRDASREVEDTLGSVRLIS